ncbi:MAG TPA: VOC family protein [Actinoplanes sp.]|nr:VOC family protein [Actinoplanes sp.]
MTVASPGVPNWMDLATADLDDAIRFYTGMFGWTAEISGDDLGGYTTFLLNGLPVAGAGPLFGEGQATAWSTYFAAPDADAVAARVEAAYGTVLVPPFDVGDQGRMAAFLDPAGAPFSVWEPGTMRGTEVFGVPCAPAWNELNTRDLEGAAHFYRAVFGWQFRGNQTYLACEMNQVPIAGLRLMAGAEWPDDLPPHWQVYFEVSDCDTAIAHAAGLGGRVVRAPITIPGARYAVLADPQGGTFAILHKHR